MRLLINAYTIASIPYFYVCNIEDNCSVLPEIHRLSRKLIYSDCKIFIFLFN